MTKALEEVFREASRLPEAEQDALAEAIKAEISTEGEWDLMLRRCDVTAGMLNRSEASEATNAGR